MRGKECEMRRREVKKLEIQKPEIAKSFVRLVCKSHEVARGKGTLS